MLFVDFPGIWDRIKRKYWFIDSVTDQVKQEKAIHLGFTGPIGARRNFSLRGRDLFTHKHIIGKTGYGKSNLLANMCKQLILQDIPVILIDPHSDLATNLLGSLIESGYFHKYIDPVSGKLSPKVTEKLLYIDFGIKDKSHNATHFLPYNVLQQPYNKRDIAQDIAEVVVRIWSYLEQSSPSLQDILKNSVVVLIDNNLPLVQMPSLLTNKPFRESLLKQVSDPTVISFFRDRFDEWDAKFAPQMKESTLNKLGNLLFSDVLRYSLGQQENALDFTKLINSGTSIIFNLGGLRKETRQFLGCLLTLGLENAMRARDELYPWERKDVFAFIDEFRQFIDTSEDAFDSFLSEVRKFRFWLILAHQYLAQLTPELLFALQNTQRVALRLEDDARLMAERIGKYNPDLNKREPEDEEARKRINPLPFNVQEEYELLANDMKGLFVGEGFVKLENRLEKFKTLRFPDTQGVYKEVEKIEAWYANTLMKKRAEVAPVVDAAFPQPATSASRPPAGFQRPLHNTLPATKY